LQQAGSLNNTNPKFGPLGLYGGPTPVFPLVLGSPAIDAGDDSVAPAADQRGRARPFGAHADIGPFESSPPYYVWGKVEGYLDPGILINSDGMNFAPDAEGNYLLGPLPAGHHAAGLSASESRFRPDPWEFDLTADQELNGFKVYKLLTFVFDGTPEQPAFTLAAYLGQIWLIESSENLKDWTTVKTVVIDNSGLATIPAPAGLNHLFMRAVLIGEPAPE
jgi:hypothetical protein